MILGMYSALQEEVDTKPFFRAVRNFYIATVKIMLEKFLFNDSILKDLGIINPEHRTVLARWKNLLNDFLN